MNWHTRDWVVGYVTRRIPKTSRSESYVRMMEAAIPATRANLDLDWIASGDVEGYRAREQTNTIGCLAFAWQAEELSCAGDPDLLEDLRQAYLGVANHITDDGRFIWPNDKDMYWAGSHEHAWRLEPLLFGWLWAGDAFQDHDREMIEAALVRASDWLIANPCDEDNNRGAVWCAITALCGILFDRQDALVQAEALGRRIFPAVVLEDGEIGEHTEQYAGGGPCTNYTYTGLGYVYLYLLLSDADWLEERLYDGMCWLARFNTIDGRPLATGASVRSASPRSPIQDALPVLERFSGRDAFFGHLATHYAANVEEAGGRFGGHITSPLIWASLAAQNENASERPEWFQNRLNVYTRPNVCYALYSGRYQAGVTFRSRKGPYRDIPEEGVPFRGLQAVSWEDEPPLVFQTRGLPSSIYLGELRSNLVDVKDADRDVRLSSSDTGHVLRERKGPLVITYVFLHATLLVRMSSRDGSRIRTFWTLGGDGTEEVALEIDPGVVALAGRQGRLYFSQGDAKVYRHTEADETRWVLDVIADPPVTFAFSDRHFSFDSVDSNDLVRITDSAGTLEVDFDLIDSSDGEQSVPESVLRFV